MKYSELRVGRRVTVSYPSPGVTGPGQVYPGVVIEMNVRFARIAMIHPRTDGVTVTRRDMDAGLVQRVLWSNS